MSPVVPALLPGRGGPDHDARLRATSSGGYRLLMTKERVDPDNVGALVDRALRAIGHTT